MYLFKPRLSAQSDNGRQANREWRQTARSRTSHLALILLVAPIFSISAGSIQVPDFSFEQPVQVSGGNDTGGNGDTTAIKNWTITAPAGNTSNGVFFPSGSDFTSVNPLPAPADRNQVAYLVPGTGNTSSITTSASLGLITANTLYTLSVALGNRNNALNFSTGTYTIDILANGLSIAESTVAGSTIPSGTFHDLSTSFTSPGSGGVVGEALTVRLSATAGSNTDEGIFDNVRLTAVPEPATWIMTFAGLGLLFLWQRRRHA